MLPTRVLLLNLGLNFIIMHINEIFEIAIKNKASDVHLVHGLAPIIRINGGLFVIEPSTNKIINLSSVDYDNFEFTQSDKPLVLDEFTGAEKYIFSDNGDIIKTDELIDREYDLKIVKSAELKKAIFGILSKEQIERLQEEKDYDFSYQYKNYRFRVNVSYEKGNMKMVARVITEEQPSLEEIGMPKHINNFLKLGQGLILVTGPTGCGKSTSLAAMINYINTNRNCNIVTLEDPIEFVFKSNKSIITQRQLGTDMPNFSSGLKHVLRQDPNVVMVGEMRDLETISTAITLAETGHLVLATLHTCNAAQTIDRIIDIFPPYQQDQIKSQLSLILSLVISQVLIPKKGGGRVAAREILINNTAVSNLIRDKKISQIKNVIETHLSEGMVSFERSVKELYEKGLIELEDAQLFLSNKVVTGI